MDSLYRDFLKDQQKDSESVTHLPQTKNSDQNQTPRPDPDSDRSHDLNGCNSQSSVSNESTPVPVPTPPIRSAQCQNQESSRVPQKLTVNQPIGRVTSCCGQGQNGPVTFSGKVEEISDEEIRNNRETEDGIRGISRFQNYQRGEPSNVRFLRSILSVRLRTASFLWSVSRVFLSRRKRKDDGVGVASQMQPNTP